MDIKQALAAAIDSDTAVAEWLPRQVGDLPKTDVVVQRLLLSRALQRIQQLEEQLEPRAGRR